MSRSGPTHRGSSQNQTAVTVEEASLRDHWWAIWHARIDRGAQRRERHRQDGWSEPSFYLAGDEELPF